MQLVSVLRMIQISNKYMAKINEQICLE